MSSENRKKVVVKPSDIQRMIETLSVGIIILSREGIIYYVNHAAAQLLGKDLDALQGSNLGIPLASTDAIEMQIRHASGTLSTVKFWQRPVEWASEPCWMVTVRDISKRKRLIREREQAQADQARAKARAELARETVKKEKALNRIKSEFLANVSHELRTPLNGIMVLSELLCENENKNLTQDELAYAETINACGATLLSLIEKLLDFSKIEANQMELDETTVDLVSFLNDIDTQFRGIANKKQIKFTTNLLLDKGTRILSDPMRLGQIIRNLLANSFKFTERGEVTFDIFKPDADRMRHDSRLWPGETIAFMVTDTGIGIPEDKIDQIFAPFRQADSSTSRKYGGTGLGLSISQKMAALLGGKIEVKSTEGEGSVFTLFCPYRTSGKNGREESFGKGRYTGRTPVPLAEPPNRDSGTMAKWPKVKNRTGFSGRKCLIVDDDVRNIFAIRSVLQSEGIQCVVAVDGKDALEKLTQEGDIDLVIMDIMMPGMDGYEACCCIRGQQRVTCDPEIPILAVTAKAAPGDREKCMEAGADAYITKPFSSSGLKDEINRVLARKSIRVRKK